MRCHAAVYAGLPLCSSVTASRARVLKSSSASKRFLDALYSSMRSDTSSSRPPSAPSPSGRSSLMCWMSMPNWVPQSPMWFRRSTSAPHISSALHSVSPMMVERRWPTCISLATLGDEKSTTHFLPRRSGANAAMSPVMSADTRCASVLGATRTLMKPGPASEVSTTSSFVGRLAMSALATSRGALGAFSLPFSLPNSCMALLHW
mmetsp:Transcript_37389/g.94340  ORF Transcript_37389/g.94340 Transcript_37389/m.94340 type:complete len:205 (-) Transcript_37389:423-1037(-)